MPVFRRFPRERVLLSRTKLAYVHLRNLLTDAKRDRTARVSGYVGIWQPDELLLLFLQQGEPVNAVRCDGGEAHPIAIADALSRVPGEPEFGEVLFHEAADEQLACMFRTLTRPPQPWPDSVTPTDPRSLLPALREEQFEGVLEVVSGDSTNYLVLGDGLIERVYLADDDGAERAAQLTRLFATAPGGKPAVRRWSGVPTLPVQAAPQLIDAYRELVARLVSDAETAGLPDAKEQAERERSRLAERHPVLSQLPIDGARVHPVADRRTLTLAVASWVVAICEAAWAEAPEEAARRVAAAGRERRQMLTAAGFTGALPWPLAW